MEVKVNYTEEIAEKLSRKYGISKTMALRNIHYINKRINKLMSDKDTLQFSFGALGTAFASPQLIRISNKKKNSIGDRGTRNYKLLKIQELRENGVISPKMYRKINKRRRIDMDFYTKSLSLKELEDYQNDYCARRR